MSDEELLHEANRLAQRLYSIMGYEVDYKYKMYEATHPQEILVWRMAVEAYEHVDGTDIEECLNVVLHEQEPQG